MKKLLLIIIMILALAISAGAAELVWDAQSHTDGFILFHHVVEDTTDIKEQDVGDVSVYDLETLDLIKGVRYEFFLRAYNAAGPSSDSDHIRWTYPLDPIIIEMLGAPINITIKP